MTYPDKEKICLKDDLYLNRKESEKLKTELMRFLFSGIGKFEDRLIGAAAWLDILADFLRAIMPGLSENVFEREKVFNTFYDSMVRENYDRLFRISNKYSTNPMIKRMFLGQVISFRNAPDRNFSLPGVILFVLINNLKYSTGIASVTLPGMNESIPVSELSRNIVNMQQDQFIEIIADWLKDYFSDENPTETEDLYPSVHQKYLFFLLYYALMKWYVKGFVYLEQRDTDTEMIRWAVRMTRDEFSQSSRFRDVVMRNTTLSDTIEKLFNRNTAPHILVREGTDE